MRLFFIIFIQSLLAGTFPLYSQENNSFLNTQRIGVADFIKKHPDADGKSVTIFILDSGVDVATPGLRYLPDSSVKVIDVQDFSGEGDVYLDLAESGGENGEKFLQSRDGLKLYGYNNLPEKASDSVYYIGSLDEYKFKNNTINDINANGKTDDRFGLILFRNHNDQWRVCVDLDADGNLTDEKCTDDYAVDPEPLKFRGYDKKYDYLPLNFALKIYPDQQKVNFHFDGSSHGTHVAGIAAGFRINNQKSFNGIAPGARIISLKIGNSRYSGASTTTGAMRDAIDFIVDYVSQNNGPIVVNMSYGIGSETEGLADIEYYINDVLAENKNVVLCVSGGNKGPGLSTIGLPAAANNAITVGAMNDADNARDIYGGNILKDKIYNFSSRGGEVAKPDVIAPGAAFSTVPPFTSSENKKGTSMASPQVTGAVALLLSAAKKEFPQKEIPGYKIKKALINSAVLLKDYTYPDQGNGLVNLSGAYEYLKEYIAEDDIQTGYEITTENPFYQSGYGSTVFWRYGTYFPTKKKKQTVFVNPVFDKGVTAEQKNKFYRSFTLTSTADWLRIVQSNTYLKGTAPAEIEVYFDEGKLKKPGLYSAQMLAYNNSGIFGSKSNKDIEFKVWCTLVVPHLASSFENDRKQFSGIKLEPGDIKREFILISPTHTAFSITTRQVNAKYANIRTYTYDPFGKVADPTAILDSENSAQQTKNISKELIPGIWEVVFYAPFNNPENSYFDYDFVLSQLDVYPKIISNFFVKNGDTPSSSFKVINNANKAVTLHVDGRIMGVQRALNINNAYAVYEHSFFVGDLYRAVEFEIELNKEIYNKLTDFTVNIKDISGKVLKTTALPYKSKEITFSPPASGNYILELVPAFALEEISWQAKLTESFFYFDQNYIKRENAVLYPFVEKTVDFSLSNQLNVAPDGYYLFGELWLDSSNQNLVRNIIPIHIASGLK